MSGPADQVADAYGLPQSPRKRPAALFWSLVFLGVYPRCARCAGTGKHGPLGVDGGKCWGCNGRGYCAHHLTADEVPALAERAPEVRAFIAYVTAHKAQIADALRDYPRPTFIS